MRSGVEPGSVDSTVIARTRSLDPELMRRVDEIFEARGALLFAGGSGASDVNSGDRARVLQTLEQFSRS